MKLTDLNLPEEILSDCGLVRKLVKYKNLPISLKAVVKLNDPKLMFYWLLQQKKVPAEIYDLATAHLEDDGAFAYWILKALIYRGDSFGFKNLDINKSNFE